MSTSGASACAMSRRERPAAMALRLLSRIMSGRMHLRHGGDNREHTHHVHDGVGGVPVKAEPRTISMSGGKSKEWRTSSRFAVSQSVEERSEVLDPLHTVMLGLWRELAA